MTTAPTDTRLDGVERWVNEGCILGPKLTSKPDDLAWAYNRWAGPRGYETLGRNVFLAVLKKAGFHHDTYRSCFVGLQLPQHN